MILSEDLEKEIEAMPDALLAWTISMKIKRHEFDFYLTRLKQEVRRRHFKEQFTVEIVSEKK